jgi:hypothetical protein
MVGYFTTRVNLHGQWSSRLETSVHIGWTGLPGRCSWLRGTEVAGTQDGLGTSIASSCSTLLLSLFTWELMWLGQSASYTVLQSMVVR